MKNLIKLSVLLAFAAILASSCNKSLLVGKGPVVTETRSVENFSKVNLHMSADVNYSYGPTYSVEVSAQENILDVLVLERVGDAISIRTQNFANITTHKQITVDIISPEFDGVDISGSGNVRVNDSYTANDAEFTISGSGDVVVNDLTAKSIEMDITGSGNMDINGGTAQSVNARISGSGEIDVDKLEADDVQTKTTGSGNMNVWATQLLDVKISGSGDVNYLGSPQLNIDISGSGKVRKL